jgi:hypothetical protein
VKREEIMKPEETMSKRTVMALAALLPLVWGCQQHPPGWDDAWAACEGEAVDQMEFADVQADQRSEWQENYIRECMEKKGFTE